MRKQFIIHIENTNHELRYSGCLEGKLIFVFSFWDNIYRNFWIWLIRILKFKYLIISKIILGECIDGCLGVDRGIPDPKPIHGRLSSL